MQDVNDKSLITLSYLIVQFSGIVNELTSAFPSQNIGAEVIPESKSVETMHLPGIGDDETIYGCTTISKPEPFDVSILYIGTVVVELERFSRTVKSLGISIAYLSAINTF